MRDLPLFDEVARFHGHACPGLALGYRASLAAFRELGIEERSEDEELVAIIENDACGVDAVQYLCGCTAGKGNLFIRDYGKHVYNFFTRGDGDGVRIYVDPFFMDDDADLRIRQLLKQNAMSADERREFESIFRARIESVLTKPEAEFIVIGKPVEKIPARAKVLGSVRCAGCGERTMDIRLRNLEGRLLCPTCFAAETR